MTDKSELEKAALAWRQAELDKRGEDFRYKPRTVDAAFQDGALWLLEQLEKEVNSWVSVNDAHGTSKRYGRKEVLQKAKELCGK